MNDNIKMIMEDLSALRDAQKKAEDMVGSVWQDKAGRIALEKVQEQTDRLKDLLAEFETLQDEDAEDPS